MTRRNSTSILGIGALIGVLVGLLACSESAPTAPNVPTLAAARGGGGSPPKVKEAIPSEAVQGESLSVEIVGSGFDDGSVVSFLLAGASTPKMVVHQTQYNNGSSLMVDLSVADDADVALYDIEVMTARGKKGIGTEKFSVKTNGPPPEDIPVSAAFRNDSDDGVLGDGPGDYDAVINVIGNLFLDARVDIPRKLCLAFAGQPGAPDDVCDDGYLSTAEPDITNGLRALPVGGSMTTRMQVTWVKLQTNWFLRFGMDCSLDDEGDRVSVRHVDENTWVLEFPAGSLAHLCGTPTRGKPGMVDYGHFAMPFQFTLTRQ